MHSHILLSVYPSAFWFCWSIYCCLFHCGLDLRYWGNKRSFLPLSNALPHFLNMLIGIKINCDSKKKKKKCTKFVQIFITDRQQTFFNSSFFFFFAFTTHFFGLPPHTFFFLFWLIETSVVFVVAATAAADAVRLQVLSGKDMKRSEKNMREKKKDFWKSVSKEWRKNYYTSLSTVNIFSVVCLFVCFLNSLHTFSLNLSAFFCI